VATLLLTGCSTLTIVCTH